MALRIDTFDNARGGNTLYKALTHPHAARPGRALVTALAARPPTAIVDPFGGAAGFAEIFGLAGVAIAGVYVQDIARIGTTVLGHRAAPVTELAIGGGRAGSSWPLAVRPVGGRGPSPPSPRRRNPPPPTRGASPRGAGPPAATTSTR